LMERPRWCYAFRARNKPAAT